MGLVKRILDKRHPWLGNRPCRCFDPPPPRGTGEALGPEGAGGRGPLVVVVFVVVMVYVCATQCVWGGRRAGKACCSA